jgi:hypothetical protein
MLGGPHDSLWDAVAAGHYASHNCQISVVVRAGGELRPAGAGVCGGEAACLLFAKGCASLPRRRDYGFLAALDSRCQLL